jgi:thiol:disulfide interchange protein DsbD
VRRLHLLIPLVACSAEPAVSPVFPRPPAGGLVRLTLLADRDRIASGAEFELAARLEIADGWHVYWVNPGDAGLPTKAKFTAPSGFEIGDVRYPGPESFRSPGGIVTYGYAGETALFARVRAPANPIERAAFSVAANWLACRETCVKGKAEANLVLPAPAFATAWPALDAIRARLPRAWSDLGVEPTWAYADGEMRMELSLAGASGAELFRVDDGGIRLLGQTVERDGRRAVLRARFSTDDPTGSALRGALRVDRDGRVTYYAVDIPWPC